MAGEREGSGSSGAASGFGAATMSRMSYPK
jgi:hypothetical protein